MPILGKEADTLRKQKEEIKRITDEIRAKKGNRDLGALNDNERSDLCKLYTTLAQKIDLLLPSLDEKEDHDEIVDLKKTKQISVERAKSLGSVMQLEIPKTTFEDIMGLDDVKKLAKSFIFMVKNSKMLADYNMQGGLGLLMYGAPGTGKTMFAEAIAHEMNLPLMIITPASIFNSHVGESEKSVREIFRQVEACPDGAILFIDECESIFGTRSGDTPDWKASVTTELLQRLNGFGVDGSKRVLIGATNRPDLIDIAFLRYKRFTHQIHIQPPDRTAIEALIVSALAKIKVNGEGPKKMTEVIDGKKRVWLENQDNILADITVAEIVKMATSGASVNDEFGPTTAQEGYYSAADVRGIIEEVCRMAIEEIQADEERQRETNPDYQAKAIKLRRDMFATAFAKIPPSISEDLLDKYRNFRRSDNGDHFNNKKG